MPISEILWPEERVDHIAQHGVRPEEFWLDYRLEHHPEFLQRVAAAREALRSSRGVRLEDLPS